MNRRFASLCSLTLATLLLAAGAGAQTASSYTVHIYVYGSLCVGETLTLQSYVYPELPEKQLKWTIETPDGVLATGSDEKLLLRLSAEGSHAASLLVSDRNGDKIGGNSTKFLVGPCASTASPSPSPTTTAEPHRDCYDERYGFYDCSNPPSPSPGCVLYRDPQTGQTYQKCETTTPSPAATSAPYNSDACAALTQEQNEFDRQWKYDYYAHYETRGTEAGSDAAFEEDTRLKRERFESDWKSRWSANGCDRPYTYVNDACSKSWTAAQAEMSDLKERWSVMWRGYYSELEAARANWSSYSEDDRRALEEAWRSRANDLASQLEAAMRSIADRNGLWECGFFLESQAPTRTAYEVSGEPMAQTGLVALRSDCDARMLAVKELYFSESESLRQKLQAADPMSSDHEALRARLAELEKRATAEMTAIMEECREDYKAAYEAPENFRDGMGSLQCYYDQTLAKIQCQGVYVSFSGDPESQFLSRFSCGGQPVFDDIYANRVFEDFQFIEDQQAVSLLIRSENLKLIFHDGPRGVINLGAVGEAELYLRPSAHLDVQSDEGRVSLSSGSWSSQWISEGTGADVSYDPVKRLITVRGEATWVAQSCRPDGSDPDGDLGDEYYDAIRARRLGAQVTISSEGDDEEDYAGMDIVIQRENGRKFLATVDSAEGTCKTVVLKFDDGIFETIRLRVVLTDENGNELPINDAENLEDILDPCNDGEEGFEYWIVQDRLGTQVIVSFAHFSEKRVSVEAASVGNVIIPGFEGPAAAAAVGIAALAFGLFRRRPAC